MDASLKSPLDAVRRIRLAANQYWFRCEHIIKILDHLAVLTEDWAVIQQTINTNCGTSSKSLPIFTDTSVFPLRGVYVMDKGSPSTNVNSVSVVDVAL